jgi:hypothetical protein
MDSRTIELTANDNTPYSWFWIDLRNGPLVIKVPPKVLGLINDMWYRWVVGVGYSQGRTRARARSTCCPRPVTTARYPRVTSSRDRARSATLSFVERRWTRSAS